MSRHINTEDFKHLINASSLYDTEEWVKVMDLLADTPTADVRENVHGKWLTVETSHEWVDDFCSICGFKAGMFGARNFCPNCGADMRRSV